MEKRKTNRLPNYDYSAPGAYFVTVCVSDRQCILSEIRSASPSDVGADVGIGPYTAASAADKIF